MLDRIDPIATVRTVFEGDVIMRNFDPGFDFDFGFGPGGPRGRRRGRAGRGDVRAAIISLLSEEPRNGYQIIQEINERTGGLWRVSSGSVYPAISQLEDEGLIEPADGNGRRLFALTAGGPRVLRAERRATRPALGGRHRGRSTRRPPAVP